MSKQIQCQCGFRMAASALPKEGVRCPACGRALVIDQPPTMATDQHQPPASHTKPDQEATVLFEPFADHTSSRKPAAEDEPTRVHDAGRARARPPQMDTYDLAGIDAQDRAVGEDAVTKVAQPGPAAPDWTGWAGPPPPEPASSHAGAAALEPTRLPPVELPLPEAWPWHILFAVHPYRQLLIGLVILAAVAICFRGWRQHQRARQEALSEFEAAAAQVRKEAGLDLSMKARQVAFESYLEALEEYRLGKTAKSDQRLRALVTLYPTSQWSGKAKNLLAGRPPEQPSDQDHPPSTSANPHSIEKPRRPE